MNKEKRNNIITATAILLLIFSIGYLSVERRKASVIENDLKDEKLTAETLLSEKLLLEKEIDKLRSELAEMTGKNKDLYKQADDSEKKLALTERQLTSVQKHNAGVRQLKKQIEELTRLKEALENQLNDSRNSIQQFKSSNDDLMLTVALLQQENKKLKEELTAASFVSLNESLIETIKRNKKITVSARRTKKLTITTDVPGDATDLKFKITSPDGNEMPVKSGDYNVKVLTGEVRSQAFYIPSTVSSGRHYKRAEITYTPVEKLKPGLYRIQIMNDSLSIGALQVRLR